MDTEKHSIATSIHSGFFMTTFRGNLAVRGLRVVRADFEEQKLPRIAPGSSRANNNLLAWAGEIAEFLRNSHDWIMATARLTVQSWSHSVGQGSNESSGAVGIMVAALPA